MWCVFLAHSDAVADAHPSFCRLHDALRLLDRLDDGLKLLRVKDRLSTSTPSGWRCIYVSIEDTQTGFVGELQLTLRKIYNIKGQWSPSAILKIDDFR